MFAYELDDFSKVPYDASDLSRMKWYISRLKWCISKHSWMHAAKRLVPFTGFASAHSMCGMQPLDSSISSSDSIATTPADDVLAQRAHS